MKTIKPLHLLLLVVLLSVAMVACLKELTPQQGKDGIIQLTLTAQKPANTNALNFDDFDFTILKAVITSKSGGDPDTTAFDAEGKAVFDVEPGTFSVMVLGQFPLPQDPEDTVYISGGTGDFLLTGAGIISADGSADPKTRTVRLNAVGGEPDIPLVIREIYYGGDRHVIEGRTVATDQYIEIYNNGTRDVVIDSLFVGTVLPFNSTSRSNGWEGRDTVGLVPNMWMIPPHRDGQPRILKPGESIVIAMATATDFTGVSRSGLRLDRAHFHAWHPDFTSRETTPGIERMQRVSSVAHAGTAGVFSTNSPAVIIYKLPNFDAYFRDEHIWQAPNTESNSDQLHQQICASWIIDGVEIYANLTDHGNRLPNSVDASFTWLPGGRLEGYAVRRKLRRELPNGHRIYMDTNNSAHDFEVAKANPRLRTD
jgi:hypothetical protein